MKHIRKLGLLFFLGLALANLGTVTVWAHANYVRSDPAANSSLPSGQPPSRIQVWFSEALEPKFSELQVFDNSRKQIDNGDSQVSSSDPQSMIVTLKPGLPDGPYTVIYKTTSAEDGHVLKNSFAFVVGAGPLPAPDAATGPAVVTQSDDNFNFWGVTLRWLNYLSAATLIGGVGWMVLVWWPSLRKVSERVGPEQAAANRAAQQRGNSLLLVALVGLVLGWVSWLLYQGTTFAGVSLLDLFGSKAFGDLFGSRFGLVWLVRLAIIVLAGLIFAFLIRRTSWPSSALTRKARFNLVPEVDPPSSTKFEAVSAAPPEITSSETKPEEVAPKTSELGYWLLLLCGAAIMLTNSLNSHAAANSNALLLIPLDWLHLMSTGLWVGGLFYLALAMPPALAALRPGTGDRTRVLAALIPNFSYIGIISVSILLVTGSIQAAIHLGSVDDLLNSNYGLALTIKLVVVAILLLFGAYHLLKVSPAMSTFAKRKSEKNGAGSIAAGQLQFTFRRTVRVEAVVAVILLGLVGGLTSFAPPAQNTPAASGLILRGQAADLSYVLQVNPAEIGNNNFTITLTQKDGQPLTKASAVLLRLSMVDMDMGTQEIELKPVPNLPGHFQTQGQILSMSGQWQATLIVRRDGFDDATSPIKFSVK